MKKNVAILLFPDVEVLDFAGPFEVFAVTDELRGYNTFNVFTVAVSLAAIRARHGLNVVPDHTLATCPPPQVLVVPGGFGTRRLLAMPPVLDWIRTQASTAEVVMSICTGSLLLAQAGLLDGLRATTHHECFDLLRQIGPHTTVSETERFIDNGKILTAAGISAGLDCSLHLVGRLLGPEAATATARYMEYHLRDQPSAAGIQAPDHGRVRA